MTTAARAPYYPEYPPQDADRFAQMLLVFATCQTPEELSQMQMAFILDRSYARQDIVVAEGRIMREKGWR